MLKKGDIVRRDLAVDVRVGTVKYKVKWLDGNTAFYKVSHIEKISDEEFAALLLMEK